MAATFYIVSGVYDYELDLTGQATINTTTINGTAFASRQGRMGNYYCTNLTDFQREFGDVDYSWTFAHGCISAFLNKGQGIWLSRVINGALFAGSIVTNDVSGVRGTSTTVMPFPEGRTGDYSTDGQQYQNLIFSGPLNAGNTITVKFQLDNSGTNITVTQAFTTDNNTTVAALATQLNTLLSNTTNVLDGYRPGGATPILVNYGNDPSTTRIIQVITPQNRELQFTQLAVASGTNPPALTYDDDAWLMEIYAIGPGEYGSDFGYQFRSVDNGVNQQSTISFAAPMVDGNFSATISINGQNFKLTPVPFTADQPTTAQAIVDEIKETLGEQSDAWVNPGTNGLVITVVSPVDGPATMLFSNVAINDTAQAAPAVATAQSLAGIDNTDTFQLWIYQRSNTAFPVERFNCSLEHQVDGYGRQLFIEDMVNTSGNRSNYIRVKFNHMNGSARLKGIPADGSPIYWLSGGYDGLLPTNAQIAAGYQSAFKSRRKTPLNLLMGAGQSSPVISQQIDTICQSRKDCFGIIEIPSDQQDPVSAVTFRQGLLGINSSYTGLYAPDVTVTNPITSSPMFLPPTGHVAAQFAYNDSVAAEWLSPAGDNRGVVTGIQGLRYTYDEGDLELIVAAQINPIIANPAGGYKISEALTLQTKSSALSNINVRRLLIVIETSLVSALDYSIYEPNTDFTGFLIVQICTNFLQPIKDGAGLYDFAVVSDSRNTTSYDIDGGTRNVDVYLKPVLPIRFIQLTSVITKTGAVFQEIIAGLSSGTISTSS